MDIREIIREEIDSDMGWIGDVEIDYKFMTEDDLKTMLDNGEISLYWVDGEVKTYSISLNNGDCKDYPSDEEAPIIVSWEEDGTEMRDSSGCSGYAYKTILKQFELGKWSLEDPR